MIARSVLTLREGSTIKPFFDIREGETIANYKLAANHQEVRARQKAMNLGV